MVNYGNGKIYKIVDFSNKNFYVGSTAQPKLCSRLGEHVSKFNCYMRGTNPKYCASMEILINENYKIFLLEIYPCNSKEELNMKEQEHIDKLRCDSLVNKQDAYVSKEDMLIKQKKYREDNKEELKIKKQIYLQEHKEEIKIKKQIYNQEHKEEIKIRKQIYHEEHKEEINAKRRGKSIEEKEVINQQQRERRKENPEKYIEYDKKRSAKRNEKNREKVECPNCKSIVSRGNLTEHKKTKKCLDFVEKMT